MLNKVEKLNNYLNINDEVSNCHMICCKRTHITVADPGFPVGGGANLVRGVPTPNVATFRKMCMSK